MAEKETLLIEEQALFERERGLVEMEAQLHEQEQGVAQIERAFKKRNRTLINLASYVSEQESGLLRRAEAIGPQAKQLVDDLLSRGDAAGVTASSQVGLESERRSLLAQRNELLELRMSLIEQREATYAARHEAIEKAEGATADLEQRLLTREREISEALRELITASSSLGGEEEEEDDDEAEPAAAARHGPASRLSRQPAAVIGGEAVRVISGAVDRDDDEVAPSGAQSRSEDEVTRRRKGRARARTNQFRITLEAQMDGPDGHAFFSYKNDNPDDVPGVFIATPNLLKVGREVRVRVGFDGGQLEATGVVSWRRQRGEAGGPPGMGIELLNLSEVDRALVGDWTARKAPLVV